MLKCVEGVFRDGKIELLEALPQQENGRVLVTFLPNPAHVDLAERGIDPARAADLAWRLSTFREDWDRPDMDVYDAL